jgi:hypothetical protein
MEVVLVHLVWITSRKATVVNIGAEIRISIVEVQILRAVVTGKTQAELICINGYLWTGYFPTDFSR